LYSPALTKMKVTRLTTMARPPLSSSTHHTMAGNIPASMLDDTSADSSSAPPMAQTSSCSGEDSSML
jgi:hypothetical protein